MGGAIVYDAKDPRVPSPGDSTVELRGGTGQAKLARDRMSSHGQAQYNVTQEGVHFRLVMPAVL